VTKIEILEARKMKKLIAMLMLTASVVNANAWTVSSTWEKQGDDYVLKDDALGVWCVAKATRIDGIKAWIYEQSPKCFSRNWIVIGQDKYRTKNHACEVHEPSTISERYHKNLVVYYKCKSNETDKEWFETLEFGFLRPTLDTDQLYIIRYDD
jgi:hypothetical protein